MSKGIHIKYDVEGEMEDSVEILKKAGISVRTLIREVLKKEANKYKKATSK